MTTIRSTPMADPNLKLPPAVRARADRASDLHKQMYSPEVTTEGNAPVPEPESAPTPTPAPAPAPAPVTPAPATPQEPAGGWEHAFKSVNARYTRAAEDNRVMAERLRTMEAQVAELRAAPVPTPLPESMITPDEVETFGADFLGVVGKKAKEIFSPEVAELRAQVEGLKTKLQNVGQTVTTNARDQMKAYMTEHLPNWVQVNDQPEFLDWLALPDAMSGAIRHNMLKDAWGRNEAARVLAIFNSFLASQEATVAPATTPKPAAPKPGKVPLETFAAPGRAKPAAAANGAPTDEKPLNITRADISQFYLDSANGKYRGREDEYKAFERAIEAANREGRIR